MRIARGEALAAKQRVLDRELHAAAFAHHDDPQRQIGTAQHSPIVDVSAQHLLDGAGVGGTDRIVGVNGKGDPRAGNDEIAQLRERKLGPGLAQQRHLALQRGGDHGEIGPPLEQGNQAEAGFVGNDRKRMARRCLDGSAIGYQ